VPEPTREDARLYLQLLEITQGAYQARARRWVIHELDAQTFKELSTKYPPRSEEGQWIVDVLGFFESAGVLVSRGLLHEDVFFDQPFGLEMLWPKFESIVDDWQKSTKDAGTWENLQWLARRHKSWRAKTWKPKSEMAPPDESPEKRESHVRGFARD
jgi:hypothetical protein